MKSHLSTFLALCAILAPSCSKEMTDSAADDCGKEQLASVEFSIAPESRTTLNGFDILWNTNDCVSVFDDKANRCFVSLNSGKSTKLKGSLHESSSYSLLYPYDEKAVLAGGEITTTLPTEQTAVKGGFGPGANLSAGTAGADLTVTMKNVGSLLSFTLPENDYSIVSARVESLDGTPLSGQIKISNLSASPAVNVLEGRNYATISGDTALPAGEYSIAVLPATCNDGIRLKLATADNRLLLKENTAPATFSRNCILDLGVLDLSKFTVWTDTPDDGSPDPVSAFASYGVDFSKLKTQGHTRLFVNDADIEAIRKRVCEICDPNDNLYAFHQQIIKRSQKVSRKTETLVYYIDENGNLLDVSNDALERLFCNSYLFRIMDDGAALARARKDLADVCAFKDWNPEDMMSVAEMTTGVAIAYDWLHKYLTLEERYMIETALYEKSLVPFSKYKPREDSNWNQSTTGGAVLTSIVLYEKYKAMCAATIDKCITSNKKAVKNIFYPYGSGKEGPGYCGYTITYEGLTLQALKSAFGTCCDIDTIEGLEKNGEWFLFMDGPQGTFNFSDASPEQLEAQIAEVFLSAHYNRPDFLLREKAVISKVSTYSTSRFLPSTAIWIYKNPFTSDAPAFPSKHVWSCDGDSPLVLVRIGWNYDATDKYVAVKAASGHSSHSHLDGGEFVYDAFGYRWSSDIKMGKYAGYKNDIYAIDGSSLFTYAKQKSLRWDILCQNNYFHSTLSFTSSNGSVDKRYVTDQITDKACITAGTFDDPSGKGCGGTVDISDHYSDAASKVLRTVNLKGDDLFVTDEITSLPGSSSQFEWRMVTVADASVSQSGDYITLSQGDKTLYLYCVADGEVLSSPQFAVEQEIVRPAGWTPRSWDSYQSYAGYHVAKYTASVKSGSKKAVFKTVISPVRP